MSKNIGAKNEVEAVNLSAEKRVCYSNGKFFIVLDNQIVDYLHIGEDDWVLQTVSDDGVSMKLLRKR